MGLPWDFNLNLSLGDLLGHIERERTPNDRLAGRRSCCFDLAPQFQQLLLSPLSLFEVSPQAEFVLDQFSIATVFPADLTWRIRPGRPTSNSAECVLPCPYLLVPNSTSEMIVR